MEEESKIKTLWKELPLKTKLIFICIGGWLIFTVIFIIILITPLMELGIIDIEGISSNIGSSSSDYSPVTGNTSFWWPIGSDETTTVNGVVYASGTPVQTWITSGFGNRDINNDGKPDNHDAIDIGDGRAYGVTNIIAAKDGVVIYPADGDPVDCPSNNNLYETCGGKSSGGNIVKIQHSDGTITAYMHLYANSITVRAGDTVKQGQVIGKMGSSGQSTGTHLHFQVISNGTVVDPLNYVSNTNTRPRAASVNYVSGDSNKQSVCLTLLNSGFADNGVAALMTNMFYESNFNPTALGDNGTSYGLCQWHNSRYDSLRNAFPDTYSSIDSQIQFLIYELDNKYSSLYNSLLEGSDSASDLAYSFCSNFERPADTENTCRKRGNNSGDFASYVNNGCQ